MIEGAQCGGPEVEGSCALVLNGDSHTYTFYDSDNGDYVLVVESTELYGGDTPYDIEVRCIN